MVTYSSLWQMCERPGWCKLNEADQVQMDFRGMSVMTLSRQLSYLNFIESPFNPIKSPHLGI